MPRESSLAERSSTKSAGEIDALAAEAIAAITPGMTIGLGTGRTSARVTRALAERVRRESLDIRCVGTSHAAENLARELNLAVIPFAKVEGLDYLFDGADEVDSRLRMLKGQYGAVARQRLVARAAKRRVYLADESKIVSRLGQRASLPICILAYGLTFVREELRNIGLCGVVRLKMDGDLYVTDDGNLVVDVTLPDLDPDTIAAAIDELPGVVDHGLFLTEADEVLVEARNGDVRRLVREA